jgi:hypothetical protein
MALVAIAVLLLLTLPSRRVHEDVLRARGRSQNAQHYHQDRDFA